MRNLRSGHHEDAFSAVTVGGEVAIEHVEGGERAQSGVAQVDISQQGEVQPVFLEETTPAGRLGFF